MGFGCLSGSCTIHRQRGMRAVEGCLLFDDRTKPKAGILASAFVCLLSSCFTFKQVT